MCVDTRMDMCVDMRMDMRVDMSMDMCVDTCMDLERCGILVELVDPLADGLGQPAVASTLKKTRVSFVGTQ